MALQPVSVPSLNPDNRTPPGRPTTAAERLAVPGLPQADRHRPDNATGRLPVAADEQREGDPLDLIKDIDKRVRESKEYQALKPFLRQVGLVDEDNSATSEGVTDKTGESPSETNSEIRFTSVQSESTTVVTWRISLTRISISMSTTPPEPPVQKSDPLALDLDGNGLETTGVDNSVNFDINADGIMDRSSFISGGDAFVALDRNGNGVIDDGGELFGDQNGDDNGFLALARYDDNGDGRIDAYDRVFRQLRLFNLSADGEQQLRTLADAGISALNLSYRNSDQAVDAYDRITQLSTFERNDGTTGQSGDLELGYRSAE